MEQWPGEFWMRRREEGPMSALSSRPEARGVILWMQGVSEGGKRVEREGETNGSAVLLMMSMGVSRVAFHLSQGAGKSVRGVGMTSRSTHGPVKRSGVTPEAGQN